MDITDEMRAVADKVAEERMAAWRMQSNRIAYVDSLARQVAYETARRLAPLIAAQALRDASARVEAAESPLCDCPRLEDPPQHLYTKAPMAHHCDCRAVTTAAAMLGSDRATGHAAECVCGRQGEP